MLNYSLSIDGQRLQTSPSVNTFEALIAKAYAAKARLSCLCKPLTPQSPQLYIARHGETLLVKRMPLTGARHHPECDHYEPPAELSGLGQVSGTAVRENIADDSTSLMLAFPLSRGAARPKGDVVDKEVESVRSDGTKLTMRATLHYLYDRAQLTRWSPAMQNKRSWGVVQRELLKVARSTKAKGSALTDLLFIPERFNENDIPGIETRRIAALARLSKSAANRMMIIGEVKELEPSRHGFRMLIKHMSNVPLYMNVDLHQRIVKIFGEQLTMWGNFAQSKLLLIGTFSQSVQGTYLLESASLACVNENWIPFESAYEYELLSQLHAAGRKFTKGLRYNLPGNKPLVSVLLQDSQDGPHALYVVPKDAVEEYQAVANTLTEQAEVKPWFWYAGESSMPALPDALPNYQTKGVEQGREAHQGQGKHEARHEQADQRAGQESKEAQQGHDEQVSQGGHSEGEDQIQTSRVVNSDPSND